MTHSSTQAAAGHLGEGKLAATRRCYYTMQSLSIVSRDIGKARKQAKRALSALAIDMTLEYAFMYK